MGVKLYDIHYHLLNLSHPNLLAFIMRDDLISKDTVRNALKKIPLFYQLIPVGILNLFPTRTATAIKELIRNDAENLLNLLSVMEGATQYHFLFSEFLLNSDKYA